VSEKCKHGLFKEYCVYCRTLSDSEEILHHKKKRQPVKEKSATIHGQSAIPAKMVTDSGFVVIYAAKPETHSRIDINTKMVHIVDYPFLWLVKLIIKEAPNVQCIQVIPKKKNSLRSSVKKLCAKHRVQLVLGHVRPDLIWEDGRNVSPHYQVQQKFFLNLSGEQLALYEELQQFGFDVVSILQRYFLLGEFEGEEFLPMRELAKEYGLNSHLSFSLRINGVIRYLDPTFSCSKKAVGFANNLQQKVVRLRRSLLAGESQAEALKAIEEEMNNFGIKNLPENFPLGRFRIYAAILKAEKDGRLNLLKKNSPLDYRALALRFGLNEKAPRYKTLCEVGELLKKEGVSRERARQLEAKALLFLELDSTSLD